MFLKNNQSGTMWKADVPESPRMIICLAFEFLQYKSSYDAPLASLPVIPLQSMSTLGEVSTFPGLTLGSLSLQSLPLQNAMNLL